MPLTTTGEVILDLGLQGVTSLQYQRYDQLRNRVEQAVKSYCRWGLEQEQNVTQYYDGRGYIDLPLRQPFVTAVSAVYLDMDGAYGQGPNAFPSTSLQTIGTDYALVLDGSPLVGYGVSKSGLLRRLSNTVYWFPSDLVYYRRAGGLSFRQTSFWPSGFGNLKVQLTYGFVPQTQTSAATWLASVATITTASAHGLWAGARVFLNNFSPTGWNGFFTVQSVPTPTTFTVSMTTNPGVVVGLGTFDGIPQDIKLAVSTAIGIIRNTVKYGWPTQSEGLGQYNYSVAIMQNILFGDVRSLLAPYRDESIAG